jgi:hypothetical protein
MIKDRLVEDMKAAMKAGDKRRLGIIRLINAAIKQREVDERITLDDAHVLAVLDKMIKQRRDSEAQYRAAGRADLADLADQEYYEIGVCQEFLPAALTEAELTALIETAITASGATTLREMGRVMAILKPQVQGRADVGAVSALVKIHLDT